MTEPEQASAPAVKSRLGWKKELHAGPRFISVASERDSYYKEKYSEFVDQLRLLSGKTGTVFALVTWLPDSSSPDVYAHDSLREIFTDHSFLQRCVERVTDYNQLARQAERTGVSSFVELGLTHGEAQALATAIMDRLKRGLKWADYNLDLPWVKAAEPQLSFAAKLDELGVPYASPLTLRASDITAAGESKVLVLLDMLASHPAECPTSTIKLALVTSGFSEKLGLTAAAEIVVEKLANKAAASAAELAVAAISADIQEQAALAAAAAPSAPNEVVARTWTEQEERAAAELQQAVETYHNGQSFKTIGGVTLRPCMGKLLFMINECGGFEQLSQLSPYGSGLKYGAMAVALGVPSKTSNKAQVLREFSTSWIKSYAEEALGGVDAYRPPWPYPDGSRVQLLDSMYQPAAEALLLHCRPSDKYHGVPVGPDRAVVLFRERDAINVERLEQQLAWHSDSFSQVVAGVTTLWECAQRGLTVMVDRKYLRILTVGQPTSLTYSKALGLLCGEAVAAQVVPESAGEELGCVARPLSDSEVSDAGLNALTAADAPSLLVLAESKGLCGSDAALRGRLEGRILQLLLGVAPAASATDVAASAANRLVCGDDADDSGEGFVLRRGVDGRQALALLDILKRRAGGAATGCPALDKLECAIDKHLPQVEGGVPGAGGSLLAASEGQHGTQQAGATALHAMSHAAAPSGAGLLLTRCSSMEGQGPQVATRASRARRREGAGASAVGGQQGTLPLGEAAGGSAGEGPGAAAEHGASGRGVADAPAGTQLERQGGRSGSGRQARSAARGVAAAGRGMAQVAATAATPVHLPHAASVPNTTDAAAAMLEMQGEGQQPGARRLAREGRGMRSNQDDFVYYHSPQKSRFAHPK